MGALLLMPLLGAALDGFRSTMRPARGGSLACKLDYLQYSCTASCYAYRGPLCAVQRSRFCPLA